MLLQLQEHFRIFQNVLENRNGSKFVAGSNLTQPLFLLNKK